MYLVKQYIVGSNKKGTIKEFLDIEKALKYWVKTARTVWDERASMNKDTVYDKVLGANIPKNYINRHSEFKIKADRDSLNSYFDVVSDKQNFKKLLLKVGADKVTDVDSVVENEYQHVRSSNFKTGVSKDDAVSTCIDTLE